MGYLLDTNVLSELRRRSPDRRVTEWLASVPSAQLFLSVLVLGEVRIGIERLRRRDPPQAEVLDAWLSRMESAFADRILPVGPAVAEEWGRLNVPDPVPVVDGLLAATAKVHDLTLATRNTKDVARTGVSVLNPFDRAT
jgi:hypothetical protein